MWTKPVATCYCVVGTTFYCPELLREAVYQEQQFLNTGSQRDRAKIQTRRSSVEAYESIALEKVRLKG